MMFCTIGCTFALSATIWKKADNVSDIPRHGRRRSISRTGKKRAGLSVWKPFNKAQGPLRETMNISDVAKITGMTSKSSRFYEGAGDAADAQRKWLSNLRSISTN